MYNVNKSYILHVHLFSYKKKSNTRLKLRAYFEILEACNYRTVVFSQ